MIEISMSKIYVILVEDRHIDPIIECKFDKDEAIELAKAFADDLCRYREDWCESNEAYKDGQIFSVSYSCEGDHVTVYEKILDD